MNADAPFSNPDILTATALGRLRTIIERLERLDEDEDATDADMKAVYAEAKAVGYDVTTLRNVLAIRRQDKAKRQMEDAILIADILSGRKPERGAE